MKSASLRFSLFICFLSFASVLSIPTADPPLVNQHAFVVEQASSSHRETTFLTRLCASIIESIWPHYSETSSKSSRPQGAPPGGLQSRYSDDVVLRFKIETQEDALAFAEAVDTLFLDVWDTSKDWADVRISQKVLPSFLTLLPVSMQQSHKPLITQLPRAVQETYPPHGEAGSTRHRVGSGMPHDLFFDNFQPLSVLYPWLRQLASMFPERTELFTIGTSYEGRDIPAFKIGFAPSSDDEATSEPRHTVVITAGSHAREWISTSTAAYLLRSLVHNFDPEHHTLINKLLTHYDFVFIPVLNPDGYDYTWTTDRLWRKNRQETSLPFCKGIDLDRAFPFGWDGDSQLDNPCSESYPGERPLQAVEAQRLVEWTKNETQSGRRVFKALVDLHSYSQEILYPYSYTCDREPHNLEDLEELAIGLAKAFRLTNGHYYDVDSACEGSMSLRTPTSAKNRTLVSTKLEDSGGSALDYFYQDLQVKYAFQIKLRDTGTYGFLLPRQHIVPTGVETFNAFMGLGRWLLGNRGIEGYTNLSNEEIWGYEEVIVNEHQDSSADDDDDGSFWWRRRR